MWKSILCAKSPGGKYDFSLESLLLAMFKAASVAALITITLAGGAGPVAQVSQVPTYTKDIRAVALEPLRHVSRRGRPGAIKPGYL